MNKPQNNTKQTRNTNKFFPLARHFMKFYMHCLYFFTKV